MSSSLNRPSITNLIETKKTESICESLQTSIFDLPMMPFNRKGSTYRERKKG